MRTAIVAAVELIATGCAGDTSVVRTDPSTFIGAKQGVMGWSPGPAQKVEAFHARGFMRRTSTVPSRGKFIAPISSTDSGPDGFGKISSAEVDFRCVASGL